MDALTTALRGAVAGLVIGLMFGLVGTLAVVVVWVASADDAGGRELAIGWGFFMVAVGSVAATVIGGAAGAASGLVAHQAGQGRSPALARRGGAVAFAALVALGATSMVSSLLLGAAPTVAAAVVVALVAYVLMGRAMVRVLPYAPAASGRLPRVVVVLVAAFVGFWALAPVGGGLGEAAGLGRDGASVVAFGAAVLGAVGAGLPTWWATAGSGRPSPGPLPSPHGPGDP